MMKFMNVFPCKIRLAKGVMVHGLRTLNLGGIVSLIVLVVQMKLKVLVSILFPKMGHLLSMK